MVKTRIIFQISIIIFFTQACLKAEKSPFDINGGAGAGISMFAVLGLSSSANSGNSVSSTSASTTDTYTLTSIAYNPTANVFALNSAIANLVPAVSGTAESYSISSALPAGLSFNTTTGVISGIPTAVVNPPASFTVTVSNAKSSANTTITISVLNTISGFSYGGVTITGGNTNTIGGIVTISATRSVNVSITPAISANSSATFSISPSLPAGLTFNTSTGNISGQPTHAQSSTSYTVTATNSLGNSSVAINIIVRPLVFVASFGASGGIAISKDGGQTFTMNNAYGTSVETISICSDYTVFMTDRNGVYKSTDHGATFSPMRINFQTYSVYCDPTNSSNIYIVAVDANPTLHLYRSIDGGTSFSIISDTVTTLNGITSSGSNFYYANGGATGTGGAYKSTNGLNFNTTIISSAGYVRDIYATSAKVYATDAANSKLLISSDSGGSFPVQINLTNPGKVMATSNDASVYVTSSTAGLYICDPNTASCSSKTTANGLDSNALSSVFVYQDGTVYMVSGSKVNIMDINGTILNYSTGLTGSLQDIAVK